MRSGNGCGSGRDADIPRSLGTGRSGVVFQAPQKRAWDFAFQTGEQTSEGKPVWRRLVYASDTKIRRHVKIRQTANPFDPQCRAYFKERAFFKKFGISCQQAGIKPS